MKKGTIWQNMRGCHQQKTFLSGQNGSVRVDVLRQSRQRHPGGRLLHALHQYHVSRCISPSDRHFAVSSRSVGLYEIHTLSFRSFDLTCAFYDDVNLRNCVDRRGRVVSYLLTLILRSLSQVDSWSSHGEIERDDLTSCSSVMVEEMGQIIMRNWDLRECRVRVNLPSPIRQVGFPIGHVITPIRALPDQIRQVVPLISHIWSYPPHRSHLHPTSLSFSSISQPSSQNTKLSHPSLSLHGMIMSWHRVQHTPSTAYTEYSTQRLFVFPSFSWLRVDRWM